MVLKAFEKSAGTSARAPPALTGALFSRPGVQACRAVASRRSSRWPERAPGFPGPENCPQIRSPTFRNTHFPAPAFSPRKRRPADGPAAGLFFRGAARAGPPCEAAASAHAACLRLSALRQACSGRLRARGVLCAWSLHACHDSVVSRVALLRRVSSIAARRQCSLLGCGGDRKSQAAQQASAGSCSCTNGNVVTGFVNCHSAFVSVRLCVSLAFDSQRQCVSGSKQRPQNEVHFPDPKKAPKV